MAGEPEQLYEGRDLAHHHFRSVFAEVVSHRLGAGSRPHLPGFSASPSGFLGVV
jgi:hypothetical protein